MSVEAMVWVLNYAEVTGTDKVVLLGIANHADAHGENAWPSVATLARYAGVSERAVQYSLCRLADAGLIVVEKQAGGTHRTAPDRRPNLYSVLMDGVKPIAPRGVKPASQRGEADCTPGVKPVAPEPSLNRPKPPAGSANAKKIDRALSLAASKSRHRVVELRARHEQNLERYCRQWPAISAEQLADYVVNGVLPQTVACLERAE